MMHFWKVKGKTFYGFGLSQIFGVIINKTGVYTFRIFNYSFGYSTDLRRFL